MQLLGANLLNKSLLGACLILFATLGFSLQAVFIPLLNQKGIDPISQSLWVMIFAFVMILVIVLFSKDANWSFQNYKLWILGSSKAMVTICYFQALTKVDAQIAVMLLYLAPVWVVMFAPLLKIESFLWLNLVRFAFAFMGGAIVLGTHFSSLFTTGLAQAGVFWAILSSFFLAMQFLGTRLWLKPQAVAGALPTVMLGAVLTIIIYVFTFNDGAVYPATMLQYGWLLLLALLAMILPTYLISKGVFLTGPTQASILSLTEPFFTVIWAIWLLNQPLKISTLLGGGLILIAGILPVKKISRWLQ